MEVAHLGLKVDWERHEDGPGRRCQRRLHGASKGRGEVGQALDFYSVFGPRARNGDHVRAKNWLLVCQPTILLASRHEQRGAFTEGVVEHAHAVSEAAANVQV